MTQSRVGDRPPPPGRTCFFSMWGRGLFSPYVWHFYPLYEGPFSPCGMLFLLVVGLFWAAPPPPTKFLRAPMGDSKTDNHKDDEKHINVVIIVLHSYGGNLLVCYSSIS